MKSRVKWRSRQTTLGISTQLSHVPKLIAQPDRHIFLKPSVTKAAAVFYDQPLQYQSRPTWDVYAALLEFAA